MRKSPPLDESIKGSVVVVGGGAQRAGLGVGRVGLGEPGETGLRLSRVWDGGAQHGLVASGVDESVAGRTRQRVLGAASCVRWLGRPQRAVEPTRPHIRREAATRNPGLQRGVRAGPLPRTFICGG